MISEIEDKIVKVFPFHGQERHFQKDEYYTIPVFSGDWKEKSACSLVERETLYPLLQMFFDLHEVKRRLGVSAIQNKFAEYEFSDPFLDKGIELVLDGYRASSVEQLLNFQIRKQNAYAVDLLRLLMIRDGCLSLIIGNTPFEAWHHLQNYINSL